MKMKIFHIISMFTIIDAVVDDCGFKRLELCDDNDAQLECQQNEQLKITKVVYIRVDNFLCIREWSSPFSRHECLSEDAFDIVSARWDVSLTFCKIPTNDYFQCNGNNQCKFNVSRDMLFDPCPKEFRYIEVEYKCNPATMTICENESYHIYCNPGTLIEVTKVFYGRANKDTCSQGSVEFFEHACFALNALDVVVRRCNGFQNCVISASNKFFGDPCPFVFKYFEIDYRCKPNVPVVICEHESYLLICKPGTKIEVTRVFYGRNNVVTCSDWPIMYFKNGCYAQNALEVVARKCNSLEMCGITAGNELFTDPCPNILKYLEIEFICK